MVWRWAMLGVGAFLAALSCLPDIEIPTPTAPKACGDGVVQFSLGETCDPGAGTTGCSADCRLACEGGTVDPVTGHCYFSVTPTFTLSNARQSCSARGGHLVRFASKSEVVLVSMTLDGGGAAWIDLEGVDAGALVAPYFHTEDNSEPGWRGGINVVKQCSGCYANTNNNPFANQFPVPEGGLDGPAVVFSKDYQYTWFAAPYDTGIFSIMVVCEREPPGRGAGPCEAGTCIEIAPTWTSKLYVLQTKASTYADADASCKMNGGTLVILQTPEEREELTRALAQANVSSAWIGLSAAQPKGWVWADKKTLESKAYIDPWGEGEPLDKTGAAYLAIGSNYDTRLAHVDGASALHPFVCEIKLR